MVYESLVLNPVQIRSTGRLNVCDDVFGGLHIHSRSKVVFFAIALQSIDCHTASEAVAGLYMKRRGKRIPPIECRVSNVEWSLRLGFGGEKVRRAKLRLLPCRGFSAGDQVYTRLWSIVWDHRNFQSLALTTRPHFG